MTDMSNSPPTYDAKKRQRVSIACLPCRAKRMRCDGQQPVCGSCVRRGIECEYQHTENKRRPPSKKYVESLQARISQLEAQLASLGSSAQLGTFAPDTEDSHEDEPEDGSSDEETDPLSELTGLVGRLNVIDDGQLHYFGSQSSYNLLKAPLHNAPSHSTPLKMQSQGLDAAAQLGLLVTISAELQDHLLELYWRWQNPWNYIVHKGAFLASLRGENDGRYCSPLLLSSIFAIAARYSDRPELCSVPGDLRTAGNAFCEQAKILLLYESEAPSVATVQAACLLALRIMSDGKEALGWLYCGNATRMAHNLGLHLDCAAWISSGQISEHEAEVRKVTWWGCFVVDKLFSLGLGRPSSIQKSGITCPKPSVNKDEEYSPWLPTSPSHKTSLGAHSHISSVAHCVSDMMVIACEAIDVIYAPNRKSSTRDVEDIVSKADVEIRTYYARIPSYLRLPSSQKVATLPHIYLFHIQYHAHLILLHRPLVQSNRPGRPKSSRMNAGRRYSVEHSDDSDEDRHMATCRDSAAEIAKLLRLYKQHYTLRQVPIAAVHLCFSAAVIHLIDARPASPHRAQAIRHLGTCVDALQDLRSPWCAWAERSLRAVQLLAREWYHCADFSDLQRRSRQEDKDRGPGPQDQVGGTPDGLVLYDTGGDIGQSFGIADANLAEGVDPGHLLDGGQMVDGTGGSADDLAFLFDFSGSEQETDALIREWLSDSGYGLTGNAADMQ